MNTIKNSVKKSQTTKAPKKASKVSVSPEVLPQLESMDDFHDSNATSFVERSVLNRKNVSWMFLSMLSITCLGLTFFYLHKKRNSSTSNDLYVASASDYQVFLSDPASNEVLETIFENREVGAYVAAESSNIQNTSGEILNPPIETAVVAEKTIAVNESNEPALPTGSSEKQSQDPKLNLNNLPLDSNNLFAHLNEEWLRDGFDTQEENFVESQTGQEFSKRMDALFKNQEKEASNVRTGNNVSIRDWLYQQHIQGIAYKGFDSCLIINSKVFHIGDIVNAHLNVIWSDIDPVEKKLYFEDALGNSYVSNY
ncbi:MAG: hypothetical protein LBH52_02500 [Puniceicoccales bacterium]|jgi:hypothetical protein|nr:hypothetical protein [Puniceicoccales bacterium]